MNTADQLIEMLKTIDETKGFLRKRCAAGQAGQSMALFEDMSSLLELLDNRYRKSGYLPRDHAPSFSANPDVLASIRFLDAVDDWVIRVKSRAERLRVRQELARGSLIDAAVKEGKPFAKQAADLAQMVQGIAGTPEERAEMDKGVSVSFSNKAVEQSRTQKEATPSTPIVVPQEIKAPENRIGIDAVTEGARLFAGVQARTGRKVSTEAQEVITPQPEVPKEVPKVEPVQPPKSTARPMSKRESTPPPLPTPTRAANPERPAAPETTTTPAVGRGIAIDREFLRIFNELGTITEEDLEKKLIAAFPKLENRYKMVICDQIRKFGYWGKLEPDRNDYEVLKRRAQELSRHRDEYSWLYGKLGDYRSRKTLLAILDNWYSFNLKDLSNMKEKLFDTYLDADLLRCTDDETFVDLGAGMGDVTIAFSEFTGHWKKIYCYEPQPGNFAALRARVRELSLVDIRQKIVSDKTEQQSLLWGDDTLLAKVSEQGSPIQAVLLDDDIKEPISIIKMCLEGGEQAAIRGCSNHIHKEHPKLIMRADHGDSDLWQLPRMIERLDKKYRFYLRHYGGNLVPTEYVLYAI